MNQFIDAHYFYIPSQGNIYTMTDLKLANGSIKLLVASLKREIYCFEYQESPVGSLVPTTKEISFTYIPNGAEIISIDAFNKSSTKNEFVIGITIIKNSNDSASLESFLNIYSEWEESEDFDIDNIAQNCLTVELNFIPYKLLHTYLVTWHEENMYSKEVPLADITIKKVEEFVLRLYKIGPEMKTVDAARYSLFGKKMSAEAMQPTTDALHLYIIRAHYQTYIWENAHIAKLELPDVTDCGWKIFETNIMLVWTTLEPVPEEAISLHKNVQLSKERIFLHWAVYM